MARSLSGTAQYFSKATAILNAMPISMAAWVFMPSFAAGSVMGLGSSTSGKHSLYHIWMQTGSPNRFQAEIINTGATVDDATAQTSITPSINTWYHVCAVFASTTSRTIYINGANAVSSAVSCAPTAADFNVTSVGNAENNAGWLTPFLGQIAFPSFWNVALSATDVAALGAAAHPMYVKPAALVACLNLTGGNSPEPDLMSSTAWTLTGAPTAAANPRIYV